MIGFSAVVKDELARLEPGSACCARAELAGLLASAGRVSADPAGQLTLAIESGHGVVARRAYQLVRRVLGVAAHILPGRRPKLDKSTYFTVRAAGQELAAALAAARITDAAGEPLAPSSLSECCRRAYLRGAFLGAGFLADPKRSYHWEIPTADRSWAGFVRYLLSLEGIEAGLARRRHEHTVYLKDADGISSWLSLVGAHQALLSLENARIYKDVKNRVNRLVNCETANLSRTINAGVQQQAFIRLIDQTIGLSALPESLRELARVRMANPEATLEELGTMLSQPLGKSGVNHRLRDLRRIADDLAAGSEDGNGDGQTLGGGRRRRLPQRGRP